MKKIKSWLLSFIIFMIFVFIMAFGLLGIFYAIMAILRLFIS